MSTQQADFPAARPAPIVPPDQVERLGFVSAAPMDVPDSLMAGLDRRQRLIAAWHCRMGWEHGRLVIVASDPLSTSAALVNAVYDGPAGSLERPISALAEFTSAALAQIDRTERAATPVAPPPSTAAADPIQIRAAAAALPPLPDADADQPGTESLYVGGRGEAAPTPMLHVCAVALVAVQDNRVLGLGPSPDDAVDDALARHPDGIQGACAAHYVTERVVWAYNVHAAEASTPIHIRMHDDQVEDDDGRLHMVADIAFPHTRESRESMAAAMSRHTGDEAAPLAAAAARAQPLLGCTGYDPRSPDAIDVAAAHALAAHDEGLAVTITEITNNQSPQAVSQVEPDDCRDSIVYEFETLHRRRTPPTNVWVLVEERMGMYAPPSPLDRPPRPSHRPRPRHTRGRGVGV